MAEIFSFLTPLKWLPNNANLAAEIVTFYPKRTETQASKNLHLPSQFEIRQLRIICMGMAS